MGELAKIYSEMGPFMASIIHVLLNRSCLLLAVTDLESCQKVIRV